MSTSANAGQSAVMGLERATRKSATANARYAAPTFSDTLNSGKASAPSRTASPAAGATDPGGGAEGDDRERPALRVRREGAEHDRAGDGGERRAAGALRKVRGAAEGPDETPRLPQAARLELAAAEQIVEGFTQIGRRGPLARTRRAGSVDQRDELVRQVRP